MSGLNKLKKNVKRSSAIILSALMTATCVDASLLSVTANAASSSSILSNEDRGVIYANSRTDFRDESIYFLITTRFYDGDPSNNARTSEDTKAKNPEDDPSWRGDFKGLIDKLDYIKALGFTAIWITPVVENNSGYDYHGYHPLHPCRLPVELLSLLALIKCVLPVYHLHAQLDVFHRVFVLF